jgi:hypothetical protein
MLSDCAVQDSGRVETEVVGSSNGRVEVLNCIYLEGLRKSTRNLGGTRYHVWLRPFAKSWKVAGSGPDEVTESLTRPWNWLSL